MVAMETLMRCNNVTKTMTLIPATVHEFTLWTNSISMATWTTTTSIPGSIETTTVWDYSAG